MAFEDLAKRMGAKRGREVGDGSRIVDPDQIIAEAAAAERRAARTRDLVLGPILILGGIVIVVLWIILIRQGIDNIRLGGRVRLEKDLRRWLILAVLSASALGVLFVGVRKILRGLGLMNR